MSYRKMFYLDDGTPAVVLQNSDHIQVWTIKEDKINSALNINLYCKTPDKVNLNTFITELNNIWNEKRKHFENVFDIFDDNATTEDADIIEPTQLTKGTCHVD